MTALGGVAPREGFKGVRIPGDARLQCAEEQVRSGIPLPDYLIKALTDTGLELGVAPPWYLAKSDSL